MLVEHLQSQDVDITDLDYAATKQGVLYPEIGYNLAIKIKNKEFDRGILICGIGLGMAMVANKVETVYAGVCHDVFSAQRLRKSNNAQVMTMGERVIGYELAKVTVDAWLNSEFQGGRSQKKVEQMRQLERQSFNSHSLTDEKIETVL